MLKETKETIVVFVTFLSLVTFQQGGGVPPWLHPRNKIVIRHLQMRVKDLNSDNF